MEHAPNTPSTATSAVRPDDLRQRLAGSRTVVLAWVATGKGPSVGSSGTLVVATRAGAVASGRLPDELCLEVLRYATTQDLGRLGRTGKAMRTLSLRELTRLPGDWRLHRMPAPDGCVYFYSASHYHAQREKPTRADLPPQRRMGSSHMHPYPVWCEPVHRAPLPATSRYRMPADYRLDRTTLIVPADYYWESKHLRTAQWERPSYADKPHMNRQNEGTDIMEQMIMRVHPDVIARGSWHGGSYGLEHGGGENYEALARDCEPAE